MDVNARQRELERLHPLDKPEGVYALLHNLHKLSHSRYEKADYFACDIIIDFFVAVDKCKFTDKQLETLQLIYIKGMTQKEIAKVRGCTQQAIQQQVKAAVHKIVMEYSGGRYDEHIQ